MYLFAQSNLLLTGSSIILKICWKSGATLFQDCSLARLGSSGLSNTSTISKKSHFTIPFHHELTQTKVHGQMSHQIKHGDGRSIKVCTTVQRVRNILHSSQPIQSTNDEIERH
mmetsp:Transcript_4876/g.7345  ORF Transcript_4876/g.7345 Transcript_4876/m.7345 type:complete len:113 (-) Transcript_4876:995-1333(-)